MRLASAIPGDHPGIDPIGLLRPTHCLGEAAHGAWVDDGGGDAGGQSRANMTTNSAWWAWQKAMSAAMPASSLSKRWHEPSRPMLPSNVAAER